MIVTFVPHSVSASSHFCALLLSGFNELKDLVHLHVVNLRSLFGASKWIANGALLRSFGAAFHKLVVDGILDENATSGAATLT